MSDLISREALITSLVDDVNTHNDKWYARLVDAFIREIYKAPTVDAVEVVRCGECAKREVCRTSTVWAVPPNDNWFCADGERKGVGE